MATDPPAVYAAVSPVNSVQFNLGRILRLSTFQIGSAMGDILTVSVWNRVMISDLGFPAWQVGLLIALRYLLSPLSIWAGNRSDTLPFLGWQRTGYIWAGRVIMLLSFPLLGFSLGRLSADPGDMGGWLLALLSFIFYGLGTLTSGSPFLALVRDSAPPAKQGLAISIVYTALLTFFPISAIGFGRWMENYDPALFWQLITGTMLIGGFFWFVAIVGQEKRNQSKPGPAAPGDETIAVGKTFKRIWADARTRIFFLFLALATGFAWMQDGIMEPFGGDAFHMPAGETTRFTGYWGTFTVIAAVFSFVVWRKRRPESVSSIARNGLIIMAAGMLLFTAAGLAGEERLIIPGLVVFGAGFGFYTFGGLSLMAAMSPDPHAGAYLGLWTIAVLIFKGAGTFLGGAFRDIFLLGLGLTPAVAYALVFAICALGLVSAGLVLYRLDVAAFAEETAQAADPLVTMQTVGLEI